MTTNWQVQGCHQGPSACPLLGEGALAGAESASPEADKRGSLKGRLTERERIAGALPSTCTHMHSPTTDLCAIEGGRSMTFSVINTSFPPMLNPSFFDVKTGDSGQRTECGG